LAGTGWSQRVDASLGLKPRARSAKSALFALLLIAFVVMFVVLMAPWPRLGPDEAAWATSVVKVLKGKIMGREAVIAKGPYLLIWHLLAYVGLGPNVIGLHLAGAAWALATGAVVCLAAHRVAGRTGLLATGLLYTAACGDLAVRTNVYAEILMALPLALGMLLLAKGLAERNSFFIAGAGCLGGLALLTKQTAVFSLLAMAIVVALVWGRGQWRNIARQRPLLLVGGICAGVPWLLWGPDALRRIARDWWALAGGVLVAALPWLAYLWRHQVGGGFMDSFVTAGAEYVSRISAAEVLENFVWSAIHVMPRYSILLLTSLAGLVYLLRISRRIHAAADAGPTPLQLPYDRGEAVLYLVLCAWYIAAVVGVAATGRFAAHYFSQLFPVAALLGGIWIAGNILPRKPVASAASMPPQAAPARLNLAKMAVIAQLLVIVPLAGMNISHWRMSLAVTAAGSPWRHVGEYLRDQTTPDDTVFVCSDQTEVLYWARRELASPKPWTTLKLLGFHHRGPLFATRVGEQVDWPWFAAELEAWQPAYVVTAPELLTVEPELAGEFGPEQLPELREILARDYRHQTDIAGYGLYARRR
jgi:4-amino-4-deoxy-L-arabinose transferase-like glycosyltransferase